MLQIKNPVVVIQFLGERIFHSAASDYDIKQKASIDEMLTKFGLQDAIPMSISIGLDVW